MDEVIELTIESADGIIDCRLEPQMIDDELTYTATILYPNTVNGYSRSEIYCHAMKYDGNDGAYYFEEGDLGVHPKIKKLENQLSDAITLNGPAE